MGTIRVVGLGPAGPDLVTSQVRELLEQASVVRLRTNRHPAASLAGDAPSFDHLYEQAEVITDVYRSIADSLVELAETGDVVYAVPGSPCVAESTVELLRDDPRATVEVLPALSFLDLTWVRLGVDPLAAQPRIVDGHRFAVEAAGERGPLLVAQCDAPWVLSEVKLAFETDTPPTVTVLQRLGLPDESITTIAWDDLDRVVEPDHLTSLWIPVVAAPVAYELARVEEVARRLRKDCPWDNEQTHESLGRYLIEESYELLDAIEQGNDDDLVEELGDVLFQAFAHSAIGAEEGRFNIADVAAGIADKLIERHPHVYGDVVAETSDDVMATWEANKKQSKGRASVMDGIPRHLPALLYASKVLKKAAGLDIHLTDDDLGDGGGGAALLLMVDQIRKGGQDAETALRSAVSRFETRVRELETDRAS